MQEHQTLGSKSNFFEMLVSFGMALFRSLFGKVSYKCAD